MLLPNLSGLHITTRTGNAAGYLARLDARMGNNAQIISVLAEAFGTALMQEVKHLAGTHGVTVENGVNIRFGYMFMEKVGRDIVLSQELLSACLAHFADRDIKELSISSDTRLMKTWGEKLSETVKTFYDFPSLQFIEDGLRGMMATDVVYMTGEIKSNEPPRSYITEMLGQPFYFRAFMQAFEKIVPLWHGGDVFETSFEQFATTSFGALGWSTNPHDLFVPFVSYATNDSYNLTTTDRTELRNRFAYDGMTLCYTKNATEFQSLWDTFLRTKELPVDTPDNIEVVPGGAWCVYIKRTKDERATLLERLEEMWKKYAKTRNLTDLVDLIQTFNGNHYFRDGNGRFSMLMIQLHMYAKEQQLVYFWNHNPNGPCLSKYVSMLNLTPRIPKNGSRRSFDKGKIKEAFETALDTRCDEELHETLPTLVPDECENAVASRNQFGYDVEGEYNPKMQRTCALFAL